MQNPNLIQEKKLFKKGSRYIAGIDEAGRGPLAGPVVAGLVVIEKKNLKKWPKMGIRDSKKLSHKKRQEVLKQIKQEAKEWHFARVGERVIDKMNVHQATLLAMKRALAKTKVSVDFLLLDGKDTLRNLPINQKAIVSGDEKSIVIAAASIVAKESRDNIMRRYARKYPEYFFGKHKGYGTKLHRKKIAQYGACKIHRKSFRLLKKNGKS